MVFYLEKLVDRDALRIQKFENSKIDFFDFHTFAW